jgi:signal transduction histidine kinase
MPKQLPPYRHDNGKGLGLATCRTIAKARGGDLTLSETPGGGTTVAVSFPAA